jgi:hypothetical protein
MEGRFCIHPTGQSWCDGKEGGDGAAFAVSRSASVEEELCAEFRSGWNFGSVGGLPLPGHGRPLRFLDHHAAQHARCGVQVIEPDKPAFALAPELNPRSVHWSAGSPAHRSWRDPNLGKVGDGAGGRNRTDTPCGTGF